ncbi:TonB-dependent receptor [Brevundimonas diminuta]|jgi:iron complex outermembrane recepter protein|uniref:TonB-dependent receptor n=1 Tax=Brevundimonas diminuta TaxID=293 RepID=UPI002899A805|nr:TonB-dependent receptor [Brevundimonas diminuta]
MTIRKQLFWASTALMSSFFMAETASAQSTGTAAVEVEQVVVTGRRGPRTIDGAMVAETVGKSRSSITQEFIETQAAGQTINEVLNLVPGMSFTNNDAYGSSGGNIRLHGFDGPRISQTFDGMPMNDSGNYSLYTNQQLDSELIGTASVNTGTTDVDSPTASASGGTINLSSIAPTTEFGGQIKGSLGDDDFRRVFALLNTGEIGPWGTRAWLAYSDQSYDKFKGLGDLNKTQYNFKVYQPIRDNGDFVSLAGHWNRNRNNNYADLQLKRNADGSASLADGVTWDSDFDTKYTAPTFRNGEGDYDDNGNRYWGLRQNPSDTGNIRAQSRITLREGLIFTFDPSFQYTLATGGSGQYVMAESQDARVDSRDVSWMALIGSKGAGGVDLNGDGDILDRVRVHSTNNTHTQRYGISSSLIWKLSDTQTLRAAYTLDDARHRQTGLNSQIDFSNPSEPRFFDPFAGLRDKEHRIVNQDGYEIRSRDRLSYATLNQFAIEYAGRFLEDTLRVNVGVRAPFFKREMNQNCYSQSKSSSVVCTTEKEIANTNGTVSFAGRNSSSGRPIEYIKPYSREVKFDDILPNINVSWNFSGNQWVYGSFAQSLTLPRTDNLYTVFFDANGDITSPITEPEKTTTYDFGYRYQTGVLMASANVWYTKFDNRIVSRYDQDLGVSFDSNVGDVDLYGFDSQIGWSPIEGLSLYATASYTDSEIANDYLDGTTVIKTGGKSLTETPDWTFGGRIQYETGPLQVGAQVKYTGERWVTDENDLYTEAYTVVNADAKFDLGYFGYKNSSLALRIVNLFDENYFGSISGAYNASRNTYAYRGAPRTMQATLTYAF